MSRQPPKRFPHLVTAGSPRLLWYPRELWQTKAPPLFCFYQLWDLMSVLSGLTEAYFKSDLPLGIISTPSQMSPRNAYPKWLHGKPAREGMEQAFDLTLASEVGSKKHRRFPSPSAARQNFRCSLWMFAMHWSTTSSSCQEKRHRVWGVGQPPTHLEYIMLFMCYICI